MARAVRIPDGLTIKVTTNVREKTTRILAYRKGHFKNAYRAVIPTCTNEGCRLKHCTSYGNSWSSVVIYRTNFHPHDIDDLVKKVIRSYC